MKPVYTSIPIDLCKYSLVNGKVNHLKLLIYLKHIASGHVRHDTSLYKSWSSDLNLSEKWIRNAIKWMIKNRWITVNSKINSLRIVSYFKICKRLEFSSKLAVIYEDNDFENIKNFCCAVAFTYILKRKNYLNRKRWSVSKMGDTRKNHNSSLKGYSTLPVRYFALCLGVSISTANNFKRCAKESGLINVKRQVITQTDDEGNKINSPDFLQAIFLLA